MNEQLPQPALAPSRLANHRSAATRSPRAVRPAWALVLAASTVALAGARLEATTMEVTSAKVSQAGDTARVCVLLKTEGKTVAGTQNDLTWDGTCATLSDKDQCEASPAHGKTLNAAMPPGSPNTLRAFVLSLTDVNPIPDSELYCCNFKSNLSTQGSCCDIGISRLGASTPDGVAIETTGTAGRICLGEAAATAAPQAPAAESKQSGGLPPWAIAVAVAAVLAIAAALLFNRKS